MKTDNLARVIRHPVPSALPPPPDMRPIGQILVDRGSLGRDDLAQALALQARLDVPLGDILLSEGLVTAADLQAGLAQQHGLPVIDLDQSPPSPAMAGALSAELCLRHGVVPWGWRDMVILVATARPDRFAALRKDPDRGGERIEPVLADEAAIRRAQIALHSDTLVRRAEARVAQEYSCRGFAHHRPRRMMLAALALAGLAALAASAGHVLVNALILMALVTLGLSVTLKTCAALAGLFLRAGRDPQPAPSVTAPARLPRISIMVPLLREREIAGALIKRLERLTYPKALLDVVLVLEASDHVTRSALAETTLPPWMRVVEVPEGSGLRTKPRALNYALDFCRGQIIGIWDAEDAPAPDQLEQVARSFAAAPADVVCLQGRLDYYNARTNWLARCFTVEYAAWWRLFVPGLASLGFVIPLGGTTLFFKRKELEELGGWDAHNVTEDADLGIRLARAGYRTRMIDTVTHEEASSRPWGWIRQRSRWLKGFAITWIVHMRHPLRLWRQLGTYRFLGLQLFFLAALSQFLLAPVFWSCWLILLGMPHPLDQIGPLTPILMCFLGAELITLGIHVVAVQGHEHRHLIPWTATMMLYFPLGTIALYKALYEMILRPFFWDKTQHGLTQRATDP